MPKTLTELEEEFVKNGSAPSAAALNVFPGNNGRDVLVQINDTEFMELICWNGAENCLSFVPVRVAWEEEVERMLPQAVSNSKHNVVGGHGFEFNIPLRHPPLSHLRDTFSEHRRNVFHGILERCLIYAEEESTLDTGKHCWLGRPVITIIGAEECLQVLFYCRLANKKEY